MFTIALNPDFVRDVKQAARTSRKYLKAEHNVSGLLADAVSNPKLAKGLDATHAYSVPLHLAPAKLSGFEVCPMATAGCRAACLHTAGNPAYMKGKARARNNRTQAYFKARTDFMIVLCAEIIRELGKAAKAGKFLAVRLNATSDIPWEKVSFTIGDRTYANIMEAFPSVVFYDYTKRHNRRALPANYSLTFSLAENNDVQALHALDNGHNVAAVFMVKRGGELPSTFKLAGRSVPVIDGDVHDYRPSDPRGVIVGLRAKGDARHDKSGFVRAV